jgi:hypothetical protein
LAGKPGAALENTADMNIFEYSVKLLNGQLSFLFFLVLLLAVYFYRAHLKKQKIIILWFIIPYLIFFVYYNKEVRFMLPALPVLALISAAGLQSIISRKQRRVIIFIIIFIGALQFFDISYNQQRSKENLCLDTLFGKLNLLYFPNDEHHAWSYGPPFIEDFKLNEIAGTVLRNYSDMNPKTAVFFEDAFTKDIFSYPFALQYYFDQCQNFYPAEDSFITFGRFDDFSKLIMAPERVNGVIFISKGNPWPKYEGYLEKYFTKEFSRVNKIKWTRLSESFSWLPESLSGLNFKEGDVYVRDFLEQKNKFTLVRVIELPRKYFAYIYEKKYSLLKKDSLKLHFSNGKAYFWYNDQQLTSDRGMRTSFEYKNKVYYSFEAVWQVKKISDDVLEAMGNWPDIPGLTQVWRLSLLSGQEIKSEVALENKEPLEIKEFQFDVSISEKYRLYTTVGKRKSFPKGENAYMVDLPCVGIEQCGLLPALLFYPRETEIQNSLFVINTKKLNHPYPYVAMISDPSLELSVGSHALCNLSLSIFPNDSKGWMARMKEISDKFSIKKGAKNK